jgi:hypothetical protein
MGIEPQKIRNFNNFASSDIGGYNNSGNNNGYHNGGTLERMGGNREHQMGWLNDGMVKKQEKIFNKNKFRNRNCTMNFTITRQVWVRCVRTILRVAETMDLGLTRTFDECNVC